MKGLITCAIALTLVAIASPAKAQACPDFGGEANIQLCGFVWTDTNGNGTQDDGELSGLTGVKVYLFAWDSATNDWALVPTADAETTDGLYAFSGGPGGFPDGLYKVVVTAPAGTVPTGTDGGDELTDSDGYSESGGSSAVVCLGSAACPARPGLPPTSSQDFDFGFKTSTKVSPGTGTPGYWKNHPEAWAAAGGGVNIGGVWYVWADAREYMGKVSKDKTISLFSQLVAAILNQGIGNEDSCIKDTIDDANEWLGSHPVGSGVTASSAAWQQISKAHSDLDDYNNGRLCAPHRN